MQMHSEGFVQARVPCWLEISIHPEDTASSLLDKPFGGSFCPSANTV